MFPYKTSLSINRQNSQPIYLQLSNQFIDLIKEGKLTPKTKLPGSRSLSELLGVHRKTVVACYEELTIQGWVETLPKKGTFIHTQLPVLHQSEFLKTHEESSKNNASFSFEKHKMLNAVDTPNTEGSLRINDGISDERLVPVDDIAKIYRRIAGRRSSYKYLSYTSTYGNLRLRKTLVEYLNRTRGLKITLDQLMITRGSQMGIYLASSLLLHDEAIIVVGDTNYSTADITFLHQKANLYRVSVDEQGLSTSELESLCKSYKIRAVYVTPHHHHPTTVTLSAERRIHLLNLASKYRFAIVEDDYDYDFNYNHAPILPLASHDIHGNVIYIGSICKTVAPVFRIGYMIGPKDFIKEATQLRRIIDRQGDALLELTFEEFISSGDLDRHIRKVLKIYEERRNLFCKLLDEELHSFLSFKKPTGGMAVWVTLKLPFQWKAIAECTKKQGLIIGDWQRYDLNNKHHSSIRIGFARYNNEEIIWVVSVLKKAFLELSQQT